MTLRTEGRRPPAPETRDEGLGIDKYALYSEAVQEPADEVLFLRKTFQEITGKTPRILREDFCGTFRVCCEWAKLGPGYVAHGLDLDPEPTHYGLAHYLPGLTPSQRSRVHVHNKNVLDPDAVAADLIIAQNFSYMIFRQRAALKGYFAACFKAINKGGLLSIDCFGGTECLEPNEETTKNRNFVYYWELSEFDPINNEARFAIHLRPHGRRKIKNVFTYHWRLWSIPEIREIMAEVGFKKTTVYWEGGEDEGNGIFTPAETGDEHQSWIAYIFAEK